MLKLARYSNYTSRFEVYLFTLRDFTEQLLIKFGGKYIERYDMPKKSGYLLQFIDADAAFEWFLNSGNFTKDESSTELLYVGKSVKGVPTDEDGNYYYVQILKGSGVCYIGLSENTPPVQIDVNKTYTADGTTTTFNTVPMIAPGTVTVTINGSTAITATDTDEDGILKQDSVQKGTINYATGVITMDTAPTDGKTVTIVAKAYQV